MTLTLSAMLRNPETGYAITSSMFFNGINARLSRVVTAGDRRKWTVSMWVKLSDKDFGIYFGASSASPNLWGSANSGYLTRSQKRLQLYHGPDVGTQDKRRTNALYRDYSAWMHIFVVWDSDNATEADRWQLWVNGARVTDFSFTGIVNQFTDSWWNGSYTHFIGGQDDTSLINAFLEAYMAEVHFVDGQALIPEDFGELVENHWAPKRFIGTYGTNGFYLDGSSANDQSGNGNNWTNSGVEFGRIDTPSNNFCKYLGDLQPPSTGGGNVKPTFNEGNTRCVGHALDSWMDAVGNMIIPRQSFYYEAQLENQGTFASLGVYDARYDGRYLVGHEAMPAVYIDYASGRLWVSTTEAAATQTSNWHGGFGTGDVIRVAGTWTGSGWAIKFARNAGDTWCNGAGSWNQPYNSAAIAGTLPVGNVGGGYVIHTTPYGATTTWNLNTGDNGTFNGQETAGGHADANGIGDFYGEVPTGHLSLCTANTSDVHATVPSEHAAIALWSGDNTANNSVSSIGFQPDFAWIKARNVGGTSHWVYDALRGPLKSVDTSTSNVELSRSTGLTSFDSDGFTASYDSGGINISGTDYWTLCLKAGGAGVSNLDGSITATVSANTTSGFSIVQYTGNGTSGATVGHGLGVVPEFIMVKTLASGNWSCYHRILGGTQQVQVNTSGTASAASSIWNDTDPSSSVVTLGNASGTNGSGNEFIMYCFAGIDVLDSSIFKIGSYEGNSNTDGPFAYLGGRPLMLLQKNADVSSAWYVFDAERDGGNPANKYIRPNLSNDELSQTYGDLLSNGVKVRSNASEWNSNTSIYLAILDSYFANNNRAR